MYGDIAFVQASALGSGLPNQLWRESASGPHSSISLGLSHGQYSLRRVWASVSDSFNVVLLLKLI